MQTSDQAAASLPPSREYLQMQADTRSTPNVFGVSAGFTIFTAAHQIQLYFTVTRQRARYLEGAVCDSGAPALIAELLRCGR